MPILASPTFSNGICHKYRAAESGALTGGGVGLLALLSAVTSLDSFLSSCAVFEGRFPSIAYSV